MSEICKHFMLNKCNKDDCKFVHDKDVCFHYWKFKNCKFGNECKKKHILHKDKYNKKKNTENFNPMTKPIDARIILDLGDKNVKMSSKLTERDILLVPNLFNDFKENEIYNLLKNELQKIPNDQLFKLWHGDTHYIADDSKRWKNEIPTFNLVINRIKQFFNMDVKATRLNLYQDTSQWKPFHFDAAAVKPDKADKQNFTIGVSFGICRDAAFERDTPDKTVISFPIKDGQIYAFSKQTNILWRHGILQELPKIDSERISIICWGWVDGMTN